MTIVCADDGTRLATDIYLPDRLPAPVVVTRTPYDRAALRPNGLGWTRRGIAYVTQDVRGRYGSGGTWNPYCDEDTDGAATLDWVHQQPWSTSDVFTAGASYGSFTAWAAATARPDKVSGVISEVPAAGIRAANREPSGVLRLAEYVRWWTEHADARISRSTQVQLETLWHLPVADIGERPWTALHDNRDELDLSQCGIPSLHIGGWYDLFLPQTLQQWESAGRKCTPRPPRSLVIGPWRHELSTPGPTEYGPASQLRLGDLQADWIYSVINGAATSTTKAFLVGAGIWLDHWPAPATTIRLYTAADGSLSHDVPASEATHRYAYDPAHPFPSVSSFQDRSRLDSRTDAVVFRGEVITSLITIVGTSTVSMRASTTAPETDWIVRLVRRLPDGQALEIAFGSAISNTGVQVIPLTPTAIRLEPGSRLELHVTSSDFPRLARNLNTGKDRYTSVATQIAIQTIHSGQDSYVDIPVLEEQ